MAVKEPHKMIEAWLNQFELEPKELLKLIESSEELDSSVRVNQAIQEGIALLESIGLPKTQLQAKYTLYLVELQAEYETTGEVLTEAGYKALEKQGWSEDGGYLVLDGSEEGLDTLATRGFTEANPGFESQLGSVEGIKLYVRLTRDKLEGCEEIKAAAKAAGYGLRLVSRGQHILFRLINIAENHMDKTINVVLRCDTGFFSDEENRGAVGQFLGHYREVGEGSVVNVRDFYPNDISGAKEVVIRFTNDGLATDRTEVLCEGKAIWSKGQNLREQVLEWAEERKGSWEIKDGYVYEGEEVVKKAKTAVEGAMGYVNINGTSVLEALPREGRGWVPVLKSGEGLDKLIVLVALESVPEVGEYFGGRVPGVLECVTGYERFLANCVPLFLFGRSGRLRDPGFGAGRVRVYNGMTLDTPEVVKLLAKYTHLIDAEGLKLIRLGGIVWREENKSVYEHLKSGEADKAFVEAYNSAVQKASEQLIKEYLGYMIG